MMIAFDGVTMDRPAAAGPSHHDHVRNPRARPPRPDDREASTRACARERLGIGTAREEFGGSTLLGQRHHIGAARLRGLRRQNALGPLGRQSARSVSLAHEYSRGTDPDELVDEVRPTRECFWKPATRLDFSRIRAMIDFAVGGLVHARLSDGTNYGTNQYAHDQAGTIRSR